LVFLSTILHVVLITDLLREVLLLSCHLGRLEQLLCNKISDWVAHEDEERILFIELLTVHHQLHDALLKPQLGIIDEFLDLEGLVFAAGVADEYRLHAGQHVQLLVGVFAVHEDNVEHLLALLTLPELLDVLDGLPEERLFQTGLGQLPADVFDHQRLVSTVCTRTHSTEHVVDEVKRVASGVSVHIAIGLALAVLLSLLLRFSQGVHKGIGFFV